MQIHEITTKKIAEGFMDAIKGIGSVAAQGINQKLGTNLGGVTAGARVGPGQRQAAASEINRGLAMKQAQQLSAQYLQSVASIMKQAGVSDPSQLDPAAQASVKKEVDQIIFKQLLPYSGITDLNQLIAQVDKSSKQQMVNLVNQINSSRQGLANLTTAQDPKASLGFWEQLTTAAAEAKNLTTFSKQQAGGSKIPSGGPASPISYDVATGQFTYNGQPYDSNDPVQKAAMSQWMKMNYKKP